MITELLELFLNFGDICRRGQLQVCIVISFVVYLGHLDLASRPREEE